MIHEAGGRSTAACFFYAFTAVSLAGIAALTAGHLMLAREQLLPSPPLTGTNCIDDKFAILRNANLSQTRVAAVGSSAAWRNLDMSLFVQEMHLPAVNAAPCYLYANQTAYFAEFLAQRMPELQYLIVVFHPRDFERCDPNREVFFDTRLASGYIDGWLPEWAPYISGFRPRYLMREARRIADVGRTYGLDVMEDDLGSSVLRSVGRWRPKLSIDPRCYAAVERLEALAVEQGFRLVVATVPAMPSWSEEEDPDGSRISRWSASLQANLIASNTQFINGTAFPVSNSDFSDPVHFLYPVHTKFTSFIIESITPNVATSQ